MINGSLKIAHTISKNDVIYDICDMAGKILIDGRLHQDVPETDICLKSLSKGKYQLYLIHEGDVFKKLISLS